MSERPWLTLVGIGEDGREGLSLRARTALDEAQTVIGGARHLALAGPLTCRTIAWPSPIERAVEDILSMRGTPAVVLATGDPFHFGIGTMLAKHVAPAEILSLPQPSAFSLAASRLCWSLQDVACVSMHGRDDHAFLRALAPGARVFVLSWNASTPAQVAAILRARGFAASRMIVLEAMGGSRERMRETTASEFDLVDIDPLNTVAVECLGPGTTALVTRACSADDAFEHDGQITKQGIRAITLAALAPRRGELLWDVGAGSGSVSIEWLRIDPANRAVAIEADRGRAERIARNATQFGVTPDIVTGRAPEAFAGLAPPDAIFVGGAVSEAQVTGAAVKALRSAGRLVANAVTIEAQAHLSRLYNEHGGELHLLQHAQAAPVGRFSGWRPAMPVVQWRWCKP